VVQGAGKGGVFFRGVTHLALDAKGRLAIPARHRDALVGAPGEPEAAAGDAGASRALVLTADPGRCLLLYPRAAWAPIQERLMALSSFNEQIRGLQRLLVGHADDVEMDNAGRILVPPALRQYAGLDHHVVLVGQGNKFELWDEAKWQEQTARTLTFPAGGLPTELDGFSL
jgi:transcriptional regulator MraZ